jgi:protein-tyrosine phosphatase
MDEAALAAKQQSLSPEEAKDIDMSNKLDRLKLAIRLGVVRDEMYIEFLSGQPGKDGYARMFKELIDLPEGESLLFHCTQGKDRTGCAAMLILPALGVDEETIIQDFALTNVYNATLIESEREMLMDMGLEGDELRMFMFALDEVNPQMMTNALDWAKQEYGSVLGYITDALNVTDAEIKLLREKYLEEDT